MSEEKKAHVYQSSLSGARSIDLIYSDEHGELQIVLGHVDLVAPKIFELIDKGYMIVYNLQPSGTPSKIDEVTKRALDSILANLASEKFNDF